MILTGMMLLLLALSCGRRSHEARLDRIWEYVSEKPETAMAALDSIDASELSESDRAFYNLTSIKAKDKAYVLHTSDSLILTVINYYSRHMDDRLYAEALYYGGRVYYDLGDYPTSLRYFQKALDLLPENTANIMLRGNVLSQTGGLLNDLGLYQEAIPYIRDVLTINKETNDTVNMFLNYKMLGAIYLHLRQFSEAMNAFNDAEKLSLCVPVECIGEIDTYKAAICYYKNEINAALANIRKAQQHTDSLSRNFTLAYASKIYLKAGMLDTAYMYAHELAMSGMPDNRKTGYMVMLSPELRRFVPKDSSDFFYDDYKRVLETTFRHQEDAHALLQNAMYNYQLHDRQKQEAEQSRDTVIIYVAVLIALISILCGFILWLLYNRKRNLVKLHEAIARLDFIESVQKTESKNSAMEEGKNENAIKEAGVSNIVKDEKTLKEELRKKSMMIRNRAQSFDLSRRILASRPYIRLQSFLRSDSPLPNEHNIFVELENIMGECYPDF